MSKIHALKKAGFRVTEVSKLMKVSRPTASNWYRGAHGPHVLVQRKLDKLVDATEKALEAGELPIPPNVVGTAARWNYINDVIAKYLAARSSAS